MALIDLKGQTLHNFLVLGWHSADNKGRARWSCQCVECSSIQVVRSDAVRRGAVCVVCRKRKAEERKAYPREVAPKKDSLTRIYRSEYTAFTNAKGRCNNPTHPQWYRYGARGIGFEYSDFKQFIEDLGPRPQGLELDRIDNNKGYSIGNCRWVSKRANILNREVTVRVQYKGRTHVMADILEELGISNKREWVRCRLARGYTFEETVQNLFQGNLKFGWKELLPHTQRLMNEPLDEMTVEYYSLPRQSNGSVFKGYLGNMAQFYSLQTCTLIRRAERHLEKFPQLKDRIPCDVSQFAGVVLKHTRDNELSKKAKAVLEENNLHTKEEIIAAIEDGKLDPSCVNRKAYGFRTYRDICDHYGVSIPMQNTRKVKKVNPRKKHKYIPRAALIAEIEQLRARLAAQTT